MLASDLINVKYLGMSYSILIYNDLTYLQYLTLSEWLHKSGNRQSIFLNLVILFFLFFHLSLLSSCYLGVKTYDLTMALKCLMVSTLHLPKVRVCCKQCCNEFTKSHTVSSKCFK